jgi:hypothetical protein
MHPERALAVVACVFLLFALAVLDLEAKADSRVGNFRPGVTTPRLPLGV